MDKAIRQLVHNRAADRCEYCHLPQSGHDERFSIDHVVPRKHGGNDSSENLALSCLRCNLFKGTDLSGVDPVSSVVVRLFDPRHDDWITHFRWNGPIVAGVTPTGRATIAVLQMNAPERVQLRQALVSEGVLKLE